MSITESKFGHIKLQKINNVDHFVKYFNNSTTAKKEYELAIILWKLNNYYFAKPIELNSNYIIYEKLDGVAKILDTTNIHYDKFMYSFICQILVILEILTKNKYSLTNIQYSHIGIQYSNITKIKNIPIFGISYKLLIYDYIFDNIEYNNINNLFKLTTYVKPAVNANIIETIRSKKYGINFEVNPPNDDVEFWMYIIFYPRLVNSQQNKTIKYLPDEDYYEIAKHWDNYKYLKKYFLKKLKNGDL